MKYPAEITINKPIEKVIELMEDANNLKEWQPGLVSFETISGQQGMVGAKAKLTFDNKGRKMEMIETIIARDFKPNFDGVNEFSATYEVEGVFNIVKNYFTRIDANTTKYSMDCEFQFNNFMMKTIGFLMPWMFRKTTNDLLKNFKKFAESQN